MTKRIFISTFLVSLITVIIAVSTVLYANYTDNIDNFTDKIKDEAMLLSVTLTNTTAEENIEILSALGSFSGRITYIAADGTVLFDNRSDPAEMENHASREEVSAAVQSGNGSAVRESATLSERTIYCARVLGNGDIIRVSGTQSTVIGTVIGLWWKILPALILALIMSLILANLTAKKIVEPINAINLKDPDIDENYNEIAPLLREIRGRNAEIEARINELSKAREEFSLITENMSEGFIITDKNADVLSYNSSALRILGAEFNESSRNIRTLNRSETFTSAVDTALSGERTEARLAISDRIYQVIVSPVFSESEVNGAVIIILDITERESREELRHEFTSNVSHELKTPLTTIYGISDMLAGGIVKPEDVRDFSEKIKSEAGRLITLIEDIINLSRMDENSINEERETVNLYELAEVCAERLSKAAENNGVTVRVTGEDSHGAEIVGVYLVLDEIIYNLLDNAIKYNRRGGEAEINVTQTPQFVKIVVSDNGIGIPNESIDRIFERFYRVDKSHSRKIGGTGLGLSIVKHGVSMHNGTVSVKSVEGNGTEITVIFPKGKR